MVITNDAMHANPKIAEELIAARNDLGKITLRLHDGDVVLPAREAILNMLLWYPLIHAGMPITKNDVFKVNPLSPDVIPEAQSHILWRMVTDLSHGKNKHEVLMLIWDSTNELYRIIMKYMGRYHQTVNYIGLRELRKDPEMHELVSTCVKPGEGPEIAQIRIGDAADRMKDMLSDPKRFKDNQLLSMMLTGNLKMSQMPQIWISHGIRSDINGVIKNHVINGSAFSGIRGPADYLIESLAGKYAEWIKKTAVADSQAAGRVLRILASVLKNVYPKWCGNTVTAPFEITSDSLKSVQYNTIVENGNRVMLTPELLKKYEGKTVNLINPITCRCRDGVCSTCAGWANGMAHMFLPPINIGIYSATCIIEIFSQLLLSTKHRNVTAVTTYSLPETAKMYFFNKGESIFLKKKFLSDKGHSLRIPLGALRPLTDLEEDYSEAVDSFSELDEIAIVHTESGKVRQRMYIATESGLPYLSMETLDILKRHSVPSDGDYLYIPLNLLRNNKPVIRILSISSDMVVAVNKMVAFLRNKGGIEQCRSYPDALQKFTRMLYKEANVNLFYVQMVLRALAIDPNGSPEVPLINDPNAVKFQGAPTGAAVNNVIDNMKFESVDNVLKQRSIILKLAHGDLPRWTASPEPYVVHKGISEFDPAFGVGLDRLNINPTHTR